LILLDVMMPGRDGFEICRLLKAHQTTQDIPIIFLTALDNTNDKIKGFEAGGVDYITKPFSVEEIGARIKTHLTIRDLQTQLHAQNQVLQAQKSELASLNASKDQFFAIIAHDLRTPLTSLLTYTRLAAERLDLFDRQELQAMIITLRDTSENMSDLLENLLQWAQLERGMMTYKLRYVDVSAILQRNLLLFAAHTQQKQIQLRNLLTEQVSAYADEQVVDVIFRNLLSNALKFTPSKGIIQVTAHATETELTVSVTDSGRGMAPDTRATLFRLEHASNRSKTTQERGAGLGLILCKELVEAIGGQITATSEPGQGSTFSFTLPRHAPAAT
jgi:two-component system, sensor histidine kinase and response regulator